MNDSHNWWNWFFHFKGFLSLCGSTFFYCQLSSLPIYETEKEVDGEAETEYAKGMHCYED